MQSFKSPITDHTYTLSLSYGRVEKIQAKHNIDLLEEKDREQNNLVAEKSKRSRMIASLKQQESKLKKEIQISLKKETGSTEINLD